MAEVKAGRAVIEALRAEGVDHIFGIVGLTTNSMVTELHGRSDIRFVDPRHEEAAAFMAYGFARASGRPTACMTTSGPGTINLLTGIALAYKGRAPVVVISGDVAQEFLDRDGNQAFDLLNIFKPVTCFARQVHTTERVIPTLRDAFRAALSGGRGPAFVGIPRNLLDDQKINAPVAAPETYRPVATRLPGDPDAIERAATLIAAAKRPLLLAGGGVIDSDATADAVALAEHAGMALAASYAHNDAVPNSHPLYVGTPGWRGATETLEAIHHADVIVALGCRLSQSTTAWDHSVLNPQTKIIQVNIDPHEIGRNYPVAVGIVGDAGAVAQQLLKTIRERKSTPAGNAAWRAEIETLTARRKARLAAELELKGDPMMPQRVFPELNKALPPECMVTLDAGVAAGLAYQRLEFERPRTLFNYAGQGGLGMGYCVGLGTKLGNPDRPALSIQGDGGFLYTSSELNTAVRHQIPLVSLVLNNRCHGSEKAQQKNNFGERYVGVDLENPRFDKLAEVYGARGYYVSRPEEIADAVAAAFKTGGPAVIEIPVAEHFPPPTKGPRAS